MNNGADHILPIEEAVDGKTEMIIRAERGQVVQRFQRPMQYILYDPINAVGVGKHLIDLGVELGATFTIELPRKQITREKRDALVARAMHIHRSLTEKRKDPKYIATEVVDSILSAIE